MPAIAPLSAQPPPLGYAAMLTIALIAVAAVLLDWVLGEPRLLHPLVGFGWLTDQLERRFNVAPQGSRQSLRLRGAFAVTLLLVPCTVIAAALIMLPYVGPVFAILALYLALGHRSLHDHARPVASALMAGDDERARALVSRMVSRDPETLDIPVAATESVLENGSDGVFAALFWFVIAGAPGVVFYRLANTLDAMWGYRNERFNDFGFAAARLDDLLNYIPARLSALTYAVVAPFIPPKEASAAGGSGALENIQRAFLCWRTQAQGWDSRNAGPVMASGAGALGVTIGGRARYKGEWHERGVLGKGAAATAPDIGRALKLVSYGLGMWLGVILILAGIANA